MTHNAKTVRAAFANATSIAQCFPTALPKGPMTFWPEILRTETEKYASEDKQKLRTLTPNDIKEYEITTSWIAFIEDHVTRRLIWMVAKGLPGWKIAKILKSSAHISASTVNRHANAAFSLIADKLNAGHSPPSLAARS